MRRVRRHLSFANVVSVIALFAALGGGTAVALNGQNTVQSDDLGPGAQVKAADVAANAVNGSKVVDNSLSSADVTGLTGADISESSLGQVPSALLGGFGRSTNGQSCNPEAASMSTVCAVVTLDLPAPTRLLLVARATGFPDPDTNWGIGHCRIGTTSGPLADTETYVSVEDSTAHSLVLGRDNIALTGVTGPIGPGQASFGLDCGELDGAIQFQSAGISAVAISPG